MEGVTCASAHQAGVEPSVTTQLIPVIPTSVKMGPPAFLGSFRITIVTAPLVGREICATKNQILVLTMPVKMVPPATPQATPIIFASVMMGGKGSSASCPSIPVFPNPA